MIIFQDRLGTNIGNKNRCVFRRPNIRSFVDHGVTGMFEEGNGHGPGSDLDALKAYVTQQQMWDPSADDREMITEFLTAYYEEGAPFVRLYMDIMHGAIADKGY
jgi:hypothetical protein